MKKDHCIDCGYDIIGNMRPPYSKRIVEGKPMTRAHAKFLFVDSRGGLCCNCYLSHIEREASDLIKRNNESRKVNKTR